jgi:hypothetical protein
MFATSALVSWRSTVPGSGELPVARFTPGAVSALTAAELCAGVRPSRVVTEEAKQQVLRNYRMERASVKTYELDALVTPELGGTTEAANLWPQRYESPVWNARVKDELERLLPALVCSHRVDLARAQQEIAADWVAAYKRYFRTDVPLQAHLQPLEDPREDNELVYGDSEATELNRVALISARFEPRQ